MTIIIQPKSKEELEKIINEEFKSNGYECDLNHIDTSLITDMSSLFFYSKFNGNISKWNTSSVVNMSEMFYNSKFNTDISQWNVSKVISMDFMFLCSTFNKDISHWNISNVLDMQQMFYESQFNQDLSNWKPINLVSYDSMFEYTQCPIPYWHSETPEQIKENINKYELAKKLEKKLNVHLNNIQKLKI